MKNPYIYASRLKFKVPHPRAKEFQKDPHRMQVPTVGGTLQTKMTMDKSPAFCVGNASSKWSMFHYHASLLEWKSLV